MTLGNKNRIKAENFRPIKDNVFVSDLDSGPHITAGGIIRPDDNRSGTGIHARWARIAFIGPDIKDEDIKVGEWVFIEHARWTNSIDLEFPSGTIRVWKIDWPDSVLLATADDPREAQLSLPGVKNLQSGKHIGRSIAPSIIRKRN